MGCGGSSTKDSAHKGHKSDDHPLEEKEKQQECQQQRQHKKKEEDAAGAEDAVTEKEKSIAFPRMVSDKAELFRFIAGAPTTTLASFPPPPSSVQSSFAFALWRLPRMQNALAACLYTQYMQAMDRLLLWQAQEKAREEQARAARKTALIASIHEQQLRRKSIIEEKEARTRPARRRRRTSRTNDDADIDDVEVSSFASEEGEEEEREKGEMGGSPASTTVHEDSPGEDENGKSILQSSAPLGSEDPLVFATCAAADAPALDASSPPPLQKKKQPRLSPPIIQEQFTITINRSLQEAAEQKLSAMSAYIAVLLFESFVCEDINLREGDWMHALECSLKPVMPLRDSATGGMLKGAKATMVFDVAKNELEESIASRVPLADILGAASSMPSIELGDEQDEGGEAVLSIHASFMWPGEGSFSRRCPWELEIRMFYCAA